jgi:hypothetical protein
MGRSPSNDAPSSSTGKCAGECFVSETSLDGNGAEICRGGASNGKLAFGSPARRIPAAAAGASDHALGHGGFDQSYILDNIISIAITSESSGTACLPGLGVCVPRLPTTVLL